MGSVDVLREITPLSPEDCFLVMQRPKRSFSYPLHVHPEFELNYSQMSEYGYFGNNNSVPCLSF